MKLKKFSKRYSSLVSLVIIVIINIIITIYKWKQVNGIPYLIDNNETYGLIREIQYRFKIEGTIKTYLFNEATSNNPLDYPIVYTHEGVSSRFFVWSLMALGLKSTETIIITLALIFGSLTITYFYKFIENFFNQKIALLVTIIFMGNYLLFNQAQFQIIIITRLALSLFVYNTILKYLKKIKVSNLELILSYFATFTIILGNPIFALYFFMSIILIILLFKEARNKIILRHVYVSITAAAVFILQLINYYGFVNFLRDLEITYLLRARGSDTLFNQAQKLSIDTNTVNLYASYTNENLDLNYVLKILNTDYLLNSGITNLMAICGAMFLMLIFCFRVYKIKNNIIANISLAILSSLVLYLSSKIYQSSYRDNQFWAKLNGDEYIYRIYDGLALKNIIIILIVVTTISLIKYLQKLRNVAGKIYITLFNIFLLITIYYLQSDFLKKNLIEVGILTYFGNLFLIQRIGLAEIKVFLFEKLLRNDHIVAVLKFICIFLISGILVTLLIPGYVNNEYYGFKRSLIMLYYYLLICLFLFVLYGFFKTIWEYEKNKLRIINSIFFLIILSKVSITFLNYDKLFDMSRLKPVQDFLLKNELKDKGFVSDNYPGAISLFAKTWGHWDSQYLGNRKDLGCLLAFDRKANNNRLVRETSSIFPKYFISVPPINYEQFIYYHDLSKKGQFPRLDYVINNLLSEDKIIFEERSSVTGSIIIELDSCALKSN